MIAQLKQEVTSHYDSLDDAPPTPPVHDKQPLYQNIGVPPKEFKGKLDSTVTAHARRMIIISIIM